MFLSLRPYTAGIRLLDRYDTFFAKAGVEVGSGAESVDLPRHFFGYSSTIEQGRPAHWKMRVTACWIHVTMAVLFCNRPIATMFLVCYFTTNITEVLAMAHQFHRLEFGRPPLSVIFAALRYGAVVALIALLIDLGMLVRYRRQRLRAKQAKHEKPPTLVQGEAAAREDDDKEFEVKDSRPGAGEEGGGGAGGYGMRGPRGGGGRGAGSGASAIHRRRLPPSDDSGVNGDVTATSCEAE